MKKLVLLALLATPTWAGIWDCGTYYPCWDFDPKNLTQLIQQVNEAKRMYALTQSVHAMIKSPGMWRSLVQAEAMGIGQKLGIPPALMNQANVILLEQSRRAALEAMMRNAGIMNLTNENASLGSLLGLQAAQVTVQEQQAQAQINVEQQLDQYLQRGTGIGAQAAKISNWEMK